MSCGVGHRHGLDLALLWLWLRPAAIVPIRPLAWGHSYAAAVALKRQKTKKKKKIIGNLFVLSAGIQENTPVVNINISIPFQILFPM